jgi:hypothetical protein
MNTRRNAPWGHSRAIADWLQPLASPKLSGASPLDWENTPCDAPTRVKRAFKEAIL